MGVLPTKNALEGFLRVCEMARKNNLNLSKAAKTCEEKAFIALQENNYVTDQYDWENLPTNHWKTTPETSWDDFLVQKKQWEDFEAQEQKWFS